MQRILLTALHMPDILHSKDLLETNYYGVGWCALAIYLAATE